MDLDASTPPRRSGRQAARSGARADRAEAAPRRDERAAAAGGAGRLLVQPLQRVRAEGRGPLARGQLRARRHPAVRVREVPRSARERRRITRRCCSTSTTGRARRARSTRTTGASCSSCTPSGVDGGYTQDDVREVARAFTGWSIESRQDPVYPLPAARARRRRQDHPRDGDQRGRREGRRASARPARAAPGDGALRGDAAGEEVRGRRSAGRR